MVRGEAVNTATTYGYDSVTMMQKPRPRSATWKLREETGDNGPHEIYL